MQASRQSPQSFLDQSDLNPLAPIKTSQQPQKNPVFFAATANPRKNNRVINVLAPLSPSSKIQFKQQFQDLLAQDESNASLIIVTIIGPKQSGKSFLLDLIVSKQQNKPSRLMSKNGKPHVSMPSVELKGNSGERVLLFDTTEQLTNQAFLWCYFMSSVVVLNLPQGDKRAQQQFLQKLQMLRMSLETQQEDLSQPNLIIVKRDSQSKQFKDKQFLSRIQNYDLFAHDIATMNIIYPGTSSVKSKDIIDVSESLLNPAFINDVQNLSYMLKSSRSKMIKGNVMGSKIAVLTLDPLTQSINKQAKVSTNKIWADVIETLSVGYYNYYMKKYSQQLTKQFQNQQPCDKYTLYKRLSRVRRSVDKKVQGFNTIAGDPTFEKYRQKLQQKLMAKQKMIKEINKRKSRQANDKLCKQLFSQMNDKNCQQLIQKYCESNLDEKAQVLLQNFETVLNQKHKQMEKVMGAKPSQQIMALQKQLADLEKKIEQEKKGHVELIKYDDTKILLHIQEKEKQIKELEAQLQKQKKLTEQRKKNQSKDVTELENKINQLKKTTKGQEQEIKKLRATKEQQAKQTIEDLTKQLRAQQEKERRLQEEVKKLQASMIKPPEPNKKPKDTCCEVM